MRLRVPVEVRRLAEIRPVAIDGDLRPGNRSVPEILQPEFPLPLAVVQ